MPPVEHQENAKDTTPMAIRVGVNIFCSYVRSPTPSHTQPFWTLQIIWEVYIFFKSSLVIIYCIVMIQHESAYDYTTSNDLVPKNETYCHDMVTDWVSTETIRENTRPPENKKKREKTRTHRREKKEKRKRKEEDTATCWKKRRKRKVEDTATCWKKRRKK